MLKVRLEPVGRLQVGASRRIVTQVKAFRDADEYAGDLEIRAHLAAGELQNATHIGTGELGAVEQQHEVTAFGEIGAEVAYLRQHGIDAATLQQRGHSNRCRETRLALHTQQE